MAPADAETILRAIAHPLRQDLLRALDGRSLSTSDLAKRFGQSIPHVRHHMVYLHRAGLIFETGREQVGNVTQTFWRSDGWVADVREVLPPEVLR